MTEFTRVAVASRVFSLAAILGLSVVFANPAAFRATLVVGVIAAIATYLSTVWAVTDHRVLAVEAGVASLVVVLALPDSALLLPYLVALPLLSGLSRGVRGAGLVIAAQFVAAVLLVFTGQGFSGVLRHSWLLAPWMLTIAGSGLLGAWVRTIGRAPARSTVDQHYEATRKLLAQLRNLARHLPSGLDPVTIADRILDAVQDSTGFERAAVFTRTSGGLFTPIVYRGANARDTLSPESTLIAESWSRSKITTGVHRGDNAPAVPSVALPLRLGSDMVGVVYAQGSLGALPASTAALQAELDELSLRLATALGFDEVRTYVTSDERQRLAREIHDGVAQDIASLGYVLDELSTITDEVDVRDGLAQLRGELSRVVTELRLSIFDLRSDVADGPGLGSALSDYVRTVGARSSMTVHLRLDESSTRLSPGVETELFRIAQEAITNARKHSGAENLWVDCWVRPPSAVIRVRDDGCGLGPGRQDSYGLRIMRERAERIEADVRVKREQDYVSERPGTCVTITLGEETPAETPELGVADERYAQRPPRR